MTALLDVLQAAVPLRILDLQALAPEDRWYTLARLAPTAAVAVAETADRAQYPTAGTARAVADLALALAVLAHAPGGVTLAGRHWQAPRRPCPGCPLETR